MVDPIQQHAIVTQELSLLRLDRAAAILFPQFSRSRLQQWIESGELTVGGVAQSVRYKVRPGDLLDLDAVPEVVVDGAEDIPLNVVFEDEQILIINKPAGLVVHPGAGNRQGTLLNALLHYCPTLESVPRAGIVHRLDKNTTGLMVVAKTLTSQNSLVSQISARSVKRIYEAIVYGELIRPGIVDAPIGRHSKQRTRMAVQAGGKPAVTHHRSLANFPHFSHIELSLETGRTHQIRVHMQHIGFPLIGDVVYGGQFRQPAGLPDELLIDTLRTFDRQALHARELSFEHPLGTGPVSFSAPLPADFERLLEIIATYDR